MVTSIFEPNIKIYEKLGFEFVKTAEIKVEGLTPLEVSHPNSFLTDVSSIA